VPCQIVVVAKSVSILTFVFVYLLCYCFWRFFVKVLAHEVTLEVSLRLYVAAFYHLASLTNYKPNCNVVRQACYTQ
jgi:hypothetical protein